MPFTFRLQSVLKYRQRIVDVKGRAVAVAGGEVARWVSQLGELDREIREEVDRKPVGGLKVQDLVAKTSWLEHLRRRRRACETGLAEAREALHLAREELQSSWRDLEVLKQLRSKQEADWSAEQETRERKELDEIGQLRSERARRSELASRRA